MFNFLYCSSTEAKCLQNDSYQSTNTVSQN